MLVESVGFPGTLKDMGPLTHPKRIPKDMGILWESYHKRGSHVLGGPWKFPLIECRECFHHIQDACGAIAWSQAWQNSPVVIWRFYQWWIRGGCIQQNWYLGWLNFKIMMSKWLIYPKHSSNIYSLVPDLFFDVFHILFWKKTWKNSQITFDWFMIPGNSRIQKHHEAPTSQTQGHTRVKSPTKTHFDDSTNLQLFQVIFHQFLETLPWRNSRRKPIPMAPFFAYHWYQCFAWKPPQRLANDQSWTSRHHLIVLRHTHAPQRIDPTSCCQQFFWIQWAK